MDLQFIGILILSFLCFTSYSLPVTFYPVLAGKFGIRADLIGIIMATFTIGGIIISLALGKFMKLWGKKRLLTISIFCLSITMILFSALDNIENKHFFIVFSIIVRTFHGISFGVIVSIAYAYIPTLYPDDVKTRVVLLEVVYGASLSFGAFFGEKLYGIGGPILPFITFAVIYFGIIYPTVMILPPDNLLIVDSSDGDYEKIDKKLLEFGPILKNSLFLSSLGVNYNYLGSVSFLLTILPIYLLGIGQQSQSASVFLLLSLAYSLSTIIFAFYCSFSMRNMMICGTWIVTVGMMFAGPSIDLGIPNEVWLAKLGLSILGIGGGMYFVIVIPELITIASNIYATEDEEMVGDMVSGVFSASCFLGELMGPIIGGFFKSRIGYERTTEVFLLQSIVISLIYTYLSKTTIIKEKKSLLLGDKELEEMND